jgi:hypothetical protein
LSNGSNRRTCQRDQNIASVNQSAFYKAAFQRFHPAGRWRPYYYHRYRRALARRFEAEHGRDPFKNGTESDATAAEAALQAAATDVTRACELVMSHADLECEVATDGVTVRLWPSGACACAALFSLTHRKNTL